MVSGAVLLAAGLTAPAHAQEDPVDDLLRDERLSTPELLGDETLKFVLFEIALLEQLGAFTPDNETVFERIHDGFGPWPETSHEQAFEVLKAIDTELAERRPAFNVLAAGQNPELSFVVGRLPAEWNLRLLAGNTEFITGHEYTGALDKLLTDAAQPADSAAGPVRLSIPELQAQLADALERLADAEQMNTLLQAEVDELRREVDAMGSRPTPATSGDGTDWVPIAAGAATAGLLVGGAVVALRRRRDGNTGEGTSEVMEAHRRLTNARTEEEVSAITVSASRQLAEGADAMLLRKVPDGLRIAGTTPIIPSSALNRIIETGQPLMTQLSGDPFWPTTTVEVAGVPVVHEGTVVGAVVVWTNGSTPFSDEIRDRLELLVPAVGGALSTADEIGMMEVMAMVDGLTSLGNRRRLDGDLETTLASAVAADLPVGFAMIDVDHFKVYNDTHGHSAGDQALQAVAQTIAACVRDSDVVYRYGGEEFSMLLPGATPEEARLVAERVRASVESLSVPGEQFQPGGQLTVSIGIATLETGPPADLKERADAALYRAKSNGRNQVAIG